MIRKPCKTSYESKASIKIYQVLIVLITIGYQGRGQEILVTPYLQPGNASTLAQEQKVLIWQTDSIPGIFNVEYRNRSEFGDTRKISSAKISMIRLTLKNKTTLLYRANLSKLQFDADYSFRVLCNGKPVAEGSFKTRTKKPQTRFAVFGDCGAGTAQQAEIAYQVYQQKPQFVLVTGDNVYSSGLESEYRKNFFPSYLAAEASSSKGAPLLNSVPFYMIVGNHDMKGSDLDSYPDGLAYFYYSDLPLNGPRIAQTSILTGNPDRVKSFLKNTKGRFPYMANFSFDHGNVHITCIDSNPYVNPLDPALVSWLTNDLKKSKADWKLVAFHHPGFNSSNAHYDYQLMRLLAPLFESLSVDLALTGHVHNYQRSLPLRFAPKDSANHYLISREGRVDGAFSLDHQFDGMMTTLPKGVIYIVSGAGGAVLYDQAISGKPELWQHTPPENWIPFTAKIVSDIHSFTLIETAEKKLVLKQIDAKGTLVDEITISK